ncbi:hypothetical protein HPB48_008866 [Haemaphysalis longicornis]|uniref:Uncharacterized protein n=1 Tax=Haemaphysalis longicornis TaxID=44386 RepID=A0A9J6H166_HAELO|nr:hypothetical protein HPB48_008866 [Haemaphysalis longicornis]
MFWPSKRKVAPKGKVAPPPAAASPVPDKALLQQALVRNACHPFYAGFRIIGRFHRLVGCAFLENLASLHHGGVRARRASLYLLYPLALWLFFLPEWRRLSVWCVTSDVGLSTSSDAW